MKCCRTCKNYNYSYGFKNGKFVGFYMSCDLKKEISNNCKIKNFKEYKSK
jgi:hypothetical protein